jgi:hypothetical protein
MSRSSSFGASKPQNSKSGSRSTMSISELDEGDDQLAQIRDETNGYLTRIDETKAELNILMMKTQSYSRNTSKNFRDSLTPHGEKSGQYERSPFGKRLHISDYSYSITPVARKSGKPRLS